MQQRVKAGEVVPMFRLPNSQGRLLTRQQYRGRANLLIVFVPDLSPASQRFMRSLAQEAASWGRDEVALLIAPATMAELRPLAEELGTRLLADVEGKVRRQFLPDTTAGGWFATDRWGELYAQGHVASASEFPPPAELRGWLEFIACECTG